MTHLTEIIEYRKLSNGQIAALIRCCGNASTDHWHTMAVDVAADPEKRKASLAEQRDFVSKQHDAAMKAETAIVEEHIGEVVQHEH